MDDAGGGEKFERLLPSPNMSDRVAARLQEAILREFRPGDSLPSQRSLGERFGVSRTVVREALRSLAAKGLVDSHPGRLVRVAAVDGTAVTESMTLFLTGSQSVDYEKVHEIRSILEASAAAIAATRATESDLDALRQAWRKMAETPDMEEAAQSDVEFHRLIARGTQNPLFGIMLDSIANALTQIRRRTLQLPGAYERAVGAHEDILNAIVRHDPIGAREAMEKHLALVKQAWAEHPLAHPGRPE
jgi:GntR family transcriptional regulator, transcriptional repressor for pyruvate dehydrogenase complex